MKKKVRRFDGTPVLGNARGLGDGRGVRQPPRTPAKFLVSGQFLRVLLLGLAGVIFSAYALVRRITQPPHPMTAPAMERATEPPTRDVPPGEIPAPEMVPTP